MQRIRLTFGPPQVSVESRPDGAMLVRSPHDLGPYPPAITHWLEHWAQKRPTASTLRSGGGLTGGR